MWKNVLFLPEAGRPYWEGKISEEEEKEKDEDEGSIGISHGRNQTTSEDVQPPPRTNPGDKADGQTMQANPGMEICFCSIMLLFWIPKIRFSFPGLWIYFIFFPPVVVCFLRATGLTKYVWLVVQLFLVGGGLVVDIAIHLSWFFTILILNVLF